DRCQLPARLHDRADRAFEQHEACRGRRSFHLRLGVLRAGDRPALLARLVLARACGAHGAGARFPSSHARTSGGPPPPGGPPRAAPRPPAAPPARAPPDRPPAPPPPPP